MYRRSMNKRQGAKNFNRKVSRTKGINMAPPPMRGGFRI